MSGICIGDSSLVEVDEGEGDLTLISFPLMPRSVGVVEDRTPFPFKDGEDEETIFLFLSLLEPTSKLGEVGLWDVNSGLKSSGKAAGRSMFTMERSGW